MPSVPAEPCPFSLDPQSAALLIIDMQRDFLEPGGFGEALDHDVAPLHPATALRRIGELHLDVAQGRTSCLDRRPGRAKLFVRLDPGCWPQETDRPWRRRV